VFLGAPQLLAVASPWAVLLAGFAVFRFFDIVKPLASRDSKDCPVGGAS